jgi:hypothetical protein
MERAASSHSMLIPSDPIICRDRPIYTAHVIDGHNVRAGSRIENKWFPKAFGLWRVRGGALALLSWNGH